MRLTDVVTAEDIQAALDSPPSVKDRWDRLWPIVSTFLRYVEPGSQADVTTVLALLDVAIERHEQAILAKLEVGE